MSYTVWYQQDFTALAWGNLEGQDGWTHPFIGSPSVNGPSALVEDFPVIGPSADLGFELAQPAHLPVSNSQLYYPCCVCKDSSGNIYIADRNNHRVRKIDALTGLISTVAGTGSPGYNGDNILATIAKLFFPQFVCVDTSDNLYIADSQNARIRKVDAVTGLISTIAGNGTTGYSGDGGLATLAQLSSAIFIAVDSSGNVYVSDQKQSGPALLLNPRIRKINAITGIITTIAGTGVWGYNGDGILATTATLRFPDGISIDASGNVYFSDSGNSRIRKVDAGTGLISTVAGNGTYGYGGDGGAATSANLAQPNGVVIDSSNNIYICDLANSRIRKVNGGTGIISTIIGNGTYGYGGDGGAAISAQISSVPNIFVDPILGIYVADSNNQRVRLVNIMGNINTIAGTGIAGYNGDGAVALPIVPVVPTWSLMSKAIGQPPVDVTNYYWEFDLSLNDSYLVNIPTAYPLSVVVRASFGEWGMANSPWSVNMTYQPGSSTHGISFSWRDKNTVQQIRYFPAIDMSSSHTMRVNVTTESVVDGSGLRTGYFLAFLVDAVQQMKVEVSKDVFLVNQLNTFCGFERTVDLTSSCKPTITNIDIEYEVVVTVLAPTPQNVNVAARNNYNILWWDAATGVIQYKVYRATMMNESDRVLTKTISTTDSKGLVDTAFLDTATNPVAVYRVASMSSSMVESEVSERVIAIKTSSMIDNKEESVDRRLFRLGISRLGEDFLA